MATANRETFIVGNWKMFKTSSEAVAYIRALTPLVKDAIDHIGLAVSFTSLEAAALVSQGSNVLIGAQNVHDASEGAFTGEISAAMLKASGAQFVIIGHSERRHVFKEDDQFINRKVHRTLQEGIRPLFCLGESLAQRESGATHEILAEQLQKGLAGISSDQAAPLIIAYEPVWAIGTGKTATPDVAQQAHHFIRECLSDLWSADVANRTAILYGGSVTPSNATVLMAQVDIDGLLVGRAALEVDSFTQIIHHHSLVSGS